MPGFIYLPKRYLGSCREKTAVRKNKQVTSINVSHPGLNNGSKVPGVGIADQYDIGITHF